MGKQKGHTNSFHQNSLKPLQPKSGQKMGSQISLFKNVCAEAHNLAITQSLSNCYQILFINIVRPCLYNSVAYAGTELKNACGRYHKETFNSGFKLAIATWILIVVVLIAAIWCCIVKSCRRTKKI